MNKREYLKSFLKEGQKRIPRKSKKSFLKMYRGEGGPVIVQTFTQFLNLYNTKEGTNIYNDIKKEQM